MIHQRKNTLLAMLALSVMALQSCDREPSDDGKTPDIINSNVQFVIDAFTPESATKTEIDPDDGNSVVWSEGDLVGVFPREGYQEPFTLETGQAGLAGADFSGGYWEMKKGMEYCAYYPFDIENFKSSDCKTSIPVTYDGQSQTGTSFGVGHFDYAYSDWNTAEGGPAVFNLHHIGALAAIELRIPRDGTYRRLRLDADSSLIPLAGHYDLTASRPELIPDTFTSYLSLDLEEFSAKAGDVCTFYIMVPPCDLSKADLSVTLAMDKGYYLFDIDSRNFEASRRYDIEATLAEVGTRGSAKARYNGADTYVNWIQLWPGGPRFAEVDLEGGLQRTWTESRSENDAARVRWGEYWYVPTKNDMMEFFKFATQDIGSDRISAIRSGNEFEFCGILEGYTDNCLTLQSFNGGTYYLTACYWTGTDETALSITFSSNYNVPGSTGWSASWSGTTSGNYLRPACALLNDMEFDDPDPDPEPDPDPDPDSPGVYLGLSVRWSSVNVGAEKPEDYGSYFSWGETVAKESYNEDTYLWGWESDMRKYCTDYVFGNKDDITVLEPEDDAASRTLGEGWRMPTSDEMAELQNKCSWEWIELNGVMGYKVTGPSSNSIFLPAAGCHDYSGYREAGSAGHYWSGSLDLENNNQAHILKLDSEGHSLAAVGRFDGLTVRPVI